MYFTGSKRHPPYLTGAYGISYLCMAKYLSGATDTDGGWSFLFLQEDLAEPPVTDDAEKSDTQRKGGMTMTVLDLITVLSFGLTCFAIGYTIGSNRAAKK